MTEPNQPRPEDLERMRKLEEVKKLFDADGVMLILIRGESADSLGSFDEKDALLIAQVMTDTLQNLTGRFLEKAKRRLEGKLDEKIPDSEIQ